MVAVMPGLFGGGKEMPREWLCGPANPGQADKAKAKRRAKNKRARHARKANR